MTKFNARLLGGVEATENKDNQEWWQNNPMTYDWDKELGEPVFDERYFFGIDNIFGYGHSLINNPCWPEGSILERFIPYEDLKGKRVLEIGCGAGLVSSHISRAGADLCAIDLTDQAIKMTTKRFEMMGLTGDIRQMDAENLEFPDASMDAVVSWGVIHHSGNMVAIIKEIHRVLRPGGKAYLMVYNRNSIRYNVYCRIWLGIFKLKLLTNTVEDIVGSVTDGYIARHLTRREFLELSDNFSAATITFSDEKTTILKYLFGVGKVFAPFYPITRPLERWLAKRWGWYLEAKLVK